MNTADARMEWLSNQIHDLRADIASGSYPNWYPATLARFIAERTSLILGKVK
jgi:hypothetical protein